MKQYKNIILIESYEEIPVKVNNNSVVLFRFPKDMLDENGQITIGGSEIHCQDIKIGALDISVLKDSTFQIDANPIPGNCTFPILYTCSDETLASVSNSGLITWLDGGEVTIDIKCENVTKQINVTLDKLLNIVFSVDNEKITIDNTEGYHNSSIISESMTLMANEDVVIHSWDEVTTEHWSVSGDIPNSVDKEITHEIGKNTTTDIRTITIDSDKGGNIELPFTINQSNLMLIPFKWEIACSNNTGAFSKKTGHLDGGTGYNDRRTIGILYNPESETYYKNCQCDGDAIFIPSNVTSMKITWNSDNNNWWMTSNIFTMNDDRSNNNTMLTRVKDTGWVYNTGEAIIDLSQWKESLYLFIGFTYTKTRNENNENHCRDLTWEDLNFNIEYTTEEKYVGFRSIQNTIKVNKETGELATADEIAAGTNDNCGRQGGETFNGKFYQFYDRNGGYNIYDVNDKTIAPEWHKLNCDSKLHFGSVAFSNIYTYNETTLTTPLIFATGHYEVNNRKVEVVDVIDIENDVLVKQYTFPNRKDDVICAWDFENSRCWVIGYEPVVGYATTDWYIDEYIIEDIASPTNTFTTQTDAYYIKGTANNTLQDCKYKDGYIYIASGWGSTKGQTISIWQYNTTLKNIVRKSLSNIATNKEAEGFALMDDYMILTTDSYMYKVQYDFDTQRLCYKVQLDFDKEITIDDLINAGCTKAEEVYVQYPNILNAVNNKTGLYFAKNSAGLGGVIKTDIIPEYTDTFEMSFRTLNTIDTNAKTLFCSRANSTASKSFTTFIISGNLRADYDNPATANDTGRYSLQVNTHYKYTRTNAGDYLNTTDIKLFKNTSIGEYSTNIPLMLGGSITSLTDYANSNGNPRPSNFLTNAIVHWFGVKGIDGKYKHLLVACEDNKMIDMVTGEIKEASKLTSENKSLNTLPFSNLNEAKSL